MEKVEGHRVTESLTEKTKESLMKAVGVMHEEKYVHGDLRPQNILVVKDNTVRIVDFDWADKEHMARYPAELNMACNWHKDVKPEGLIRNTHDLYQMQSITQ